MRSRVLPAATLAPPKPGLVATAIFASIVVFLGVSLEGLRAQSLVGYLAVLPVSITTTAGLALVATARVDAVGSELRVVNVLLTWRVPLSSIDALDVSNGIHVKVGERTIDSFAWGSSVLQTFIRTRRMRRAQRAMLAWYEGADGSSGAQREAAIGPQRRVRPAVLIAPIVSAAASLGLAVILWLSRATLLPIIN